MVCQTVSLCSTIALSWKATAPCMSTAVTSLITQPAELPTNTLDQLYEHAALISSLHTALYVLPGSDMLCTTFEKFT